jgi:hypothetical protein
MYGIGTTDKWSLSLCITYVCDVTIYISKSKIIRTFAIIAFQVCHTAFCECMLRVGTTVVM